MGIACSQGSTCQSGRSKVTHVWNLVIPSDQQWMPSLRFSFSKYNTLEEVDRAVEVLADFVTKD
jgi:cysteine desulfurase